MLGQMPPNCLVESKNDKGEQVDSIDFVQIFEAYSKETARRIL